MIQDQPSQERYSHVLCGFGLGLTPVELHGVFDADQQFVTICVQQFFGVLGHAIR
jgi:hypothetical protein